MTPGRPEYTKNTTNRWKLLHFDGKIKKLFF
jgi:hypothetical protein